MRFKTGFLLGCAVGGWAVSKASQLRRGDRDRTDWPRSASGEEGFATAERLRAIGDLARERFSDLLDSPLGEMARTRVGEILTGSGSRPSNGSRGSAPN